MRLRRSHSPAELRIECRASGSRDVDVSGFPEEDRPDDRRQNRNDHRIPQTIVDVSREGDHCSCEQRQAGTS